MVGVLHGRRGVGATLAVAALLACALLACALVAAPAFARRAPTPTHRAVSPEDAAATLAYLQANYQLYLALVRDAPAVRSAQTAFARQTGRECSGVLAGAPADEPGAQSPRSTPPRERGEQALRERQGTTIGLELESAFFAAGAQSEQPAEAAYGAAVATLSWTNPEIAPLVQAQISGFTSSLPAIDACADMKAWAASDFHALSAASREFEAKLRAASEPSESTDSVETLLKPYEDARDRELIHRFTALRSKLAAALFAGGDEFPRMEHALGIPKRPAEEPQEQPVIGRGSTSLDHQGFVVRQAAPEEAAGAHCKHLVAVEINESTPGTVVLSSSSGSSLCLANSSRHGVSSGCSEGVESVAAVVPSSVRTVRLQLSDGRTLTSRVVHVPPRFGGPAGVYVQVFRGSAHATSMTELNAAGGIVTVMPLRTLACQPKPRREPRPAGPHFVNLAKGTAPNGEAFVIQATIAHFAGHETSFSLSLPKGPGVGRGESSEVETGPKPKAFRSTLSMECSPRESAIVYGILAAPGASVLARTTTGLVPLTEVTLSANLHSEGPLFYGAFTTPPTELVVLRADGSTLYTESLAARDREEAEFCEGYAEP